MHGCPTPWGGLTNKRREDEGSLTHAATLSPWSRTTGVPLSTHKPHMWNRAIPLHLSRPSAIPTNSAQFQRPRSFKRSMHHDYRLDTRQ